MSPPRPADAWWSGSDREWVHGIGRNPLGDDGVRELVQAPQLARVRTLDVAGSTNDEERPTAALGQALVTAPMAASLESLELTLGALGPEGARGLAAAPLVRLRRLGLYGNGIGDAGAVALARSSALSSLRSLDLGNNDLHDDAALALAGSPHLGALERLELGGAKLTSRAREALQARFGERVRLKYPWG